MKKYTDIISESQNQIDKKKYAKYKVEQIALNGFGAAISKIESGAKKVLPKDVTEEEEVWFYQSVGKRLIEIIKSEYSIK